MYQKGPPDPNGLLVYFRNAPNRSVNSSRVVCDGLGTWEPSAAHPQAVPCQSSVVQVADATFGNEELNQRIQHLLPAGVQPSQVRVQQPFNGFH